MGVLFRLKTYSARTFRLKNYLRFINRVSSTCLSIFSSIWPYLEIFNFAEIWEFQLLSLITENRDWNSKIGSPFLLRLYTLSTYPKFQEKWSTTGLKTRSSKTPKIASLETHKSKQKTKFKNLLPICCQYFLEERTVKVWCKSAHHRPRNSITDNPLKRSFKVLSGLLFL